MDQSRLDGRSRGHAAAGHGAPRPVHDGVTLQPARAAIRFEPPKLTSIGGGRISRSTADIGALAEAREQGRAEALAEMAAALEQHRRATDDLDAATRALSASLDQVGLADLERIDGVERQVLTLAVALAEAIIGREVSLDDGLVVTAAERALGLVPDRGPVVLRVNPGDVAAVRDALDTGAAGGHLASSVQVVADPAVARAGAVAEVGPLRVDAQIAAALARIRDAFSD